MTPEPPQTTEAPTPETDEHQFYSYSEDELGNERAELVTTSHFARQLERDRDQLRARVDVLTKERDAAVSERVACHHLFDDVLAICGYGKGQGYPGIVGAAQKLRNELTAATSALKAARDALGLIANTGMDAKQCRDVASAALKGGSEQL